MFDIKNEKWFIRVGNKQEAVAAQEWAFKQGLPWGGKFKLRTDFESWDTKGVSAAIGAGHCGGGCLVQASTSFWERNGHKEIKLTYKLTVDTVTPPELESEQQKQIKALEATIAMAAAQIQKLKEEI